MDLIFDFQHLFKEPLGAWYYWIPNLFVCWCNIVDCMVHSYVGFILIIIIARLIMVFAGRVRGGVEPNFFMILLEEKLY